MKKIAIFMLSLITIYLTSCGLSEDTVAKVGSIEISKDEFQKEILARYPGKTDASGLDSTAKYSVLNQIIERKLKLNDAYDLDLDEDPTIQKALQDQKERGLMNKYYEIIVVDKIITPEELKEFYDKQKEEVKASHILLGYKGANRSRATRSKEEALNLAKELAKRANNGEDFAMLAEKYSDDPSAKRNKGDLGFFSWGRMVPEFQEAAFNLKVNEISEPVETSYGYHIIKVTDRRQNPKFNPDNFEKEKRNIKVQLYRTKHEQGQKIWQDHMNELTEKYDAKVLDENIKVLIDSVKARNKNGKRNADAITDADKKLVLAVWNGNEISLNDIMERYGNQISRFYSRLKDTLSLAKEMKSFMESKMVINSALELGLDRDKDQVENLAKLKESRMISLVER